LHGRRREAGAAPRRQNGVRRGEQPRRLASASYVPYQWGVSTDIPVPKDYDGDGRDEAGNQQTPVDHVPATESAGVTATYAVGTPDAVMRTGNIAFSGTATAAPGGGGLAHENRQPYLTVSYCIALAGVFPPRV
jgi:microcystin-dependent protein